MLLFDAQTLHVVSEMNNICGEMEEDEYLNTNRGVEIVATAPSEQVAYDISGVSSRHLP